jgi:pyrroline-5-carboxylate reductase
VENEKQLDAVTALSGSGPAYVFYFLEAMTRAGVAMGLSSAQAHQLAVGTFVGASELARRSDDPPEVLRQRVTSKGGTTYAACSHSKDGVGASFGAPCTPPSSAPTRWKRVRCLRCLWPLALIP